MTQPTTKTPRTDEAIYEGYCPRNSTRGEDVVSPDFARQLETELNEWRECAEMLSRMVNPEQKIKAYNRFTELKTKYGDPRANP